MNLASVVPALLMAGFVRNLGFIIKFAGLAGFVMLMVPGANFYIARKQCILIGIDVK